MSGPGGLCARFGRFNLVGVLGATLQMLLFDFLIRRWQWPEVVAMPIAVEIVLLHNFCWHERFTWRDRGLDGFRHKVTRLWRFHAANGLISIAGNTVLVYWFVAKLKAPALPSGIAAIALCAPTNFLLADLWIFKRRRY